MVQVLFATRSAAFLLLLFLLFPFHLNALTMEELRADSNLTPQRLLAHFADFEFELHDQVLAPEKFLATRRGDCDDFAALAATILREKGYTTRLMVVFMDRDVHVVCYVAETRSFLDYNRRKNCALTDSTGTLEDVAEKVATTFRSHWRSVSEFTYAQGGRHFVNTEFR